MKYPTLLKSILLAAINVSTIVNNGMAQEGAQSAPIIDPFSISQDNLGAISNSVNLFTGDISMPLSLVSIPGRDGIGINVSAFYSSSNIENLVGMWNLDAPTGILGLGWSLPGSQIIVD